MLFNWKTRRFWKRQAEYPLVEKRALRSNCDRGVILEYIASNDCKTILDIGTGDGKTMLDVAGMTSGKRYILNDISDSLLAGISRRWKHKKNELVILAGDLLSLPDWIPGPVDLALSFGSLCYVFGERRIARFLKTLDAKALIVRLPCSATDADIVVDRYSVDLRQRYTSIYRPVWKVLRMLSHSFKVKEIRRAWPEKLDSRFGTEQWLFICERREK